MSRTKIHQPDCRTFVYTAPSHQAVLSKLLAKGWTCLCCGAAVTASAQSVSTGPHYYVDPATSFHVGAAGSPGKDADGSGGKCRSGPVPGTAGANGTTVVQSVTYSGGPSFDGSIVAAGSSGGAGGAGGNGDPQGECGKGDFNGSAGGAGGDVQVTVSSDAATEHYTITNTGIVALSHGGSGGKGGDNTRSKDQYSGGDGGAAGNAGKVSIVNHVSLNVTGGQSAYGIVAQSAGGQGGEGGDSSNGKAKGGSGLPGGTGNAVSVTNSGNITTGGGMAIGAQSIGGFGGDAGLNTKGYGGGGGFGGNGGAVSVDNSGTLIVGAAGRSACAEGQTSGCNPAGMFALAAQSVGGGGGNAGAAAGLHALGASGGTAGNGAAVSLNNNGAVSIFGESSVGIYAQSIGGGGGSGGMAISSGAHTTAIGGSGGDGGSGSTVFVNNSGTICTGAACTSGEAMTPNNQTAGGAVGLLAQSIGGGGGIGGYAEAKGKTHAIFGGSSAVAVGGTGGSGGNGGTVNVLNTGAIRTLEMGSAGIMAQSVGGGGGAGGGSLAFSTAVLGDAAAVSMGGSGGSGGSGGAVTVNCNRYSAWSSGFSACGGQSGLSAIAAGAQISTAGLASPGIVAQSIGGGGGAGGYAMALSGSVLGSASFGFGGSGGVGGTGGAVFASTNGGNIATLGDYSQGMLAQSIGGGGGSGGSTMDLSLAYAGSSISVGVGGSGGSGTAGQSVLAYNPGGNITTKGHGSQGIAAQSIGGGGGNGGSAVTFAASGKYSAALSVGGKGANGGAGGSVTLVNENNSTNPAWGSGAITTHGYAASALLAQSIGGGGGSGGYTVGASGAMFAAAAAAIGGSGGSGNNASDVQVYNSGALSTLGGGAAALQAQSIGGGGGSGGYAYAGSLAEIGAVSVGVGGAGGSGASGGAVTVNNSGVIVVAAQETGNAPGILAQSLGGGGGAGSFAAAGAAGLVAAASVAVGGGGGNGGKAADVTVNQSAGMQVVGDMSSGILAQSIGGNGGTGGFALAGGLAGGANLAAAVGSGGGAGGTSGNVTLNLMGAGQSLSTKGHQSAALLAQSIGGSGGTGGWSLGASASLLAAPSVSLGGVGGKGGKSGTVVVKNDQNLWTAGLMSPAVLAQSIGGSGGSGGFSAAGSASSVVALATALGGAGGAGSAAGAVKVLNTGTIHTAADRSMGIVAQSIGGNGGNGGSALAGSLSTGNPETSVSVGASVALGSNGGTGQTASVVSVTSHGAIQTSGFQSVGIVAQSVGGGGGNGGNSSAFSAAPSGSSSMSASVAVGGKGAAGGNADTVQVMAFGDILTGAPLTAGAVSNSDQAIGILAQSIGGSGGNGGAATANAVAGKESVAVAVGGGGGAGSQAGTVAVNFDAAEYLSSWSDLMSDYGSNVAAALAHYARSGILEGRATSTFNAAQYLANYADLRTNYGNDLTAAANHYLLYGKNEGRTDRPVAGAAVASMPVLGRITTYGNQAAAIVAQSIGGGGGNGGSASSSATSNKYAASLAIGGYGAGGGNGDTVVVVSADDLVTHGAQSVGILAQSVGGGGGNGGAAASSAAGAQGAVKDAAVAAYTGIVGKTVSGATLSVAQKFGGNSEPANDAGADNGIGASLSIGGAGGMGGNGGMVAVATSGAIQTSGDLSSGVFAQSVGGGGGNGGSSSSNAAGGNHAASFSLGGSGAVGGDASLVSVVNDGSIRTSGVQSLGVFAQSVGGGGGNGGSSSSSAGSGGAMAASFGLGGSGGGGGNAGTVTVVNNGLIATLGSHSAGIFAQSVGGGGGNGGAASSAASAAQAQDTEDESTHASTGSVSSQNAPAAGGNSATAGDVPASGSTAASKGSGAGAAGGYAAGLSLGGAGGRGSVGGNVVVNNIGTIITGMQGNTDAGVQSSAIFAQSVGGGGGNGGASSSNADAGKTSVALSLGGIGGGAGAGGAVTVTSRGGNLLTYGNQASGVFAQSVGGGGGAGGSSSSTSGNGGSVSTALGLGGSGAGGGNGGAVLVCGGTNGAACSSGVSGTVETFGEMSYGIFAQSVGGGGGSGGSVMTAATAAQSKEDSDEENAASSKSNGTSAAAASGVALAAGLGGSGGGGGDGGSVTVALDGRVVTHGNLATGVYAQSVGGGGGAGGASSGNANGGAYAASFSLGGSGSKGGKGGAVAVSTGTDSAITTEGELAFGILAQSVGGGGGVAGSSSSTAAEGGKASIGMAMGGSAGSGQDGGAVQVNHQGVIATRGFGADGIVAQSVGGGGGLGGSSNASSSADKTSVSLAMGGSGGAGGNGGIVSVVFSNAIVTAGDEASGIFAQSVGGGGGAGASASSGAEAGGDSSTPLAMSLGGSGSGGGAGGTVTVTGNNIKGTAVTVSSGGQQRQYEAAIITGGANSAGILAQSVGGGGGNGGASNSTTQAASSNAVSIGLGGAAGAGSNGGVVSVCGTISGTVCASSVSGAAILTAGANSVGILAQSVGGGGGNGAAAGSSANTDGEKAGHSLSASLGGKSGGGGNGGGVSVSSAVQVQTLGNLSTGVLTQSIGGGGGSGGSASSSSATSNGSQTVSANLALGGSGGKGGSGGTAIATLDGIGQEIVTGGVGASAVIVQSIGGGGGVAGLAVTSLSHNSAGTSNISGALGSTGGNGGNGGYAALINKQNLTTYGDQSMGLLTQSIGGGGGLASAYTFGDGVMSGTMSLGSKGGDAGVGGAVYVNNTGSVTTYGRFSSGMVVQSLGGGGGVSSARAGNVVLGGNGNDAAGLVDVWGSFAVATAGDESAGMVLQGIGGGGGLATATETVSLGGALGGSDGRTVNMCNQWASSVACVDGSKVEGGITTQGKAAPGLLAQSIGGGGGALLQADSAVAANFVAGTGVSGAVTMIQNLAVTTAGAGSVGMLVQAIGGGGGAVLSVYNNGWVNNYAGDIGGSGGGNDYGSTVFLRAYDKGIRTYGANAAALAVQSIGANGGYYSVTNLADSNTMNSSYALGADRGRGGSSQVTVALGSGGAQTPLWTQGVNSPGLVAQSIGGGGGIVSFANAGNSTSPGGTVAGVLGQSGGSGRGAAVNVSGSAAINTVGAQSVGLLAQSISGGGGLAMVGGRTGGAFNGTVKLGSIKGDSDYTDPVTVKLTGGSITTSGIMSAGLVAQDIGGGGGVSLARASNVVLGGATQSSSLTGNNSKVVAVQVDNAAAISTWGDGSVGIVAQSIGGGGGLAYSTGSATLGGAPGGSHAGSVVVNSNAPIVTHGVNAFGILAQSVGGGGGAVLSTGNGVASNFWGGSGNASDVTVNVHSSIHTTGAGAHGVVAQSVRGGGGLVVDGTKVVMQGGKNGSSGLVRVTVSSGVSIKTEGAGAVGIKTWSSTDPIVEIAAGASVIGGAGGAALEFEGPTNELYNSGNVATVDGAAGMAVRTLSGDTTVKNSGMLLGSIHLDHTGNNLVHNLEQGTLAAGSVIDLGKGGQLRNDGLLQVGRGESTASTRITGSFQQSEGGVLGLRVDHASGSVDALNISGKAQLAGHLQPIFVNAGSIKPGTVSLGSFLSAEQGVSTDDLSVGNTAIMRFELSRNNDSLALSSTANFSPQGLAEDGRRLGAIVAQAQERELVHFQELAAHLVEVPTVAELERAYWNASGASASAVSTVGARASTAFTRTLLQPHGTAMNDGAAQRSAGNERHSTWAQFYTDSSQMRLDPTKADGHLKSHGRGLVIGHEYLWSPDTTVGMALGSGVSYFNVANHFSGRDNALHVGAYAEHRMGNAYVSGAAAYTTHKMKTNRSLELLQASYDADFRAHSLAARAEAGYTVTSGTLKVTPYAALQVQKVTTPAYSEASTNSVSPKLALDYERRSVNVTRTELGVSVDKKFLLSGNKAINMGASAAWVREHSSHQDISAAFQAMPDSNFQNGAIKSPGNQALVAASAEIELAKGLAVGVQASGEFGRGAQNATGWATLRYQW